MATIDSRSQIRQTEETYRERREMEPHFYSCLLLCRSRVRRDSQAKLEPLALLVPKQRR